MEAKFETQEWSLSTSLGDIFIKEWTPKNVKNSVPLILLHDSLGCVETWREFPMKLSESLGRVVIAYDRVGFGKSSERTELPSLHFIREESEIYLPQILKFLKIEKCVLLGHSVGGAMALVAASHMDSVAGVISISAQAFVEDRTLEGVRVSQKAFRDIERLNKLKKYHGEKASWVVRAWTDVWLDYDYSSWSLKKDLPKIKCPVFVIHGDRDEYGSVKFPEMIYEGVKDSQIKIMEGTGHVPHKEKESEVLQMVQSFLEKRKL